MSVTLASQKSGMRGRRGKPVMVVQRWTGHASARFCQNFEFTSPHEERPELVVMPSPSMSPPSVLWRE